MRFYVIITISITFSILLLETNCKTLTDLENVQKLDLNSNEVNINTNETKAKLNPMESKNTKECDKRLAQCMKCGQFAPKIGDASCPPGLECCVLVFK